MTSIGMDLPMVSFCNFIIFFLKSFCFVKRDKQSPEIQSIARQLTNSTVQPVLYKLYHYSVGEK